MLLPCLPRPQATQTNVVAKTLTSTMALGALDQVFVAQKFISHQVHGLTITTDNVGLPDPVFPDNPHHLSAPGAI